MAGEPQISPPLPEPAAAAPATRQPEPAGEPIEPTSGQVEASTIRAQASQDIDELWAQLEGRAAPESPPASKPAPAASPDPATVEAKAPREAAETPPPAVDRAAIEREVRERIRAEEQARAEAEARVRQEADRRREVEVFRGGEAEYGAVAAALRQFNLNGETGLLDALDVPLVTLAGVKTVSELKGGQKGLTPEEAANVLNQWEIARKYEDVLGDRKVAAILGLWDREVMAELGHADVDGEAVRAHATPASQMKALRESVTERVTKRVSEPLAAEIAQLKADLRARDERIASLVAERGNLTSQQRAASAATIDRPGQGGGSAPRGIPTTAEELAAMSVDDFFKSGVNDELFRRLDGVSPMRRGSRRAG